VDAQLIARARIAKRYDHEARLLAPRDDLRTTPDWFSLVNARQQHQTGCRRATEDLHLVAA